MENLLLKLHAIEELSELNKFFKDNFLKNFTIIVNNDSDFTYSVICSTVFNNNEYFFDSEILEEVPFFLNDVQVFSIKSFQYPNNVKFLILIHDKDDITEEEEFLFKHFIIAYQKLSLIKYYENSLVTSKMQLDFLNEIGDILGNFDLQIVLTKILENAVNLVDGDVGVIFLFENNKLIEKISWGVPKDVLTKIINKFTNNSVIDEIYNNKETLLIENLTTNTEYEFSLKDKYKINSFVGLPIFTKNRSLGVLALVNFEVDIDFTEIKLATLETLAQISSIGIENAIFFKDSIEKEKLLTELNIAANLQKQLLPEENFYTDKFYIGGFSIPAKNVGGDFFNYITEDNKLIAFVGDVAGKGIPAALLTTMAMSLLKTLIFEFKELKKVVYKINNVITTENLGEKYFTLGIFSIDFTNLKMELINAGHTEILHYRIKKNDILKYESTNLPIGMFEDIDYENIITNIEKGDILFSFSDGIPDAINEDGERYELKRLTDIIMKNSYLPPEQIKNKILEDVKNFCGEAEQFDDLTLMVVKIL